MYKIKKVISEKKLDTCINQYKIFDYLIYARVARVITRQILKTNLRPNHITIISLFFGILAGFFFSLGDYYYLIVGAVLMQLVQVFDTVDGTVARFKNLYSDFGGFFDLSVNMITGYIAIATISTGIFLKTQNPKVLIFGILGVGNFFMIHILRYSFRWKVSSIKTFNDYQISKKVCIGAADTFTFLILVFSLLNQLYLFLISLALIGGLIWIKKLFDYYKISKKGTLKNNSNRF